MSIDRNHVELRQPIELRWRRRSPARLSRGVAAAVGVLAGVVFLTIGILPLTPEAASEQASQPGSPAARGLDLGRDHSCALLGSGSVRCWGWAANGRLGYANANTVGDDESPGSAGSVDLGAGRTATAVTAGDAHTCALLDDRAVRCWGFNTDGQLGYGHRNAVGDDEAPGSAGPVNVGAGRAAVALTTGAYHTCALLDDGKVRCWGSNFYAQLGYARTPTIGDDESPAAVGTVDLGDGRSAIAISAGARHTCALLDGGDVRCWGDAANGQLGYGNAQRIGDDEAPGTVEPVGLGAGRSAVAISAGAYHTCALLDDGTLRCWGYGANGQLGLGNTASLGDDESPTSAGTVGLGPGRRATAVSAGDLHSCALLDDGAVRCWGAGAEGRLGYGNTRAIGDDESPGSVGTVNLGPGRRAIAISAGGAHTCARLDDASVTCWGHGGNGRLGYCNERSVGDNEAPAAVGPVPLEQEARAPSAAYPGCARAPGAAAPGPRQAAGGPQGPSPLVAEASRRRGYRSCLRRSARHTRREISRARGGSGGRGALPRSHIRRHARLLRGACTKRYGRTPGRIAGLEARALSSSVVELRFRAAGSHGDRPPAARSYVVRQSLRPIRGRRAFRRARALCKGRCRFPTVTEVGGRLTLTVQDLRGGTTYYYAVAARDNVSGRHGPRSRTVGVRTR